MKYMKKKHYPSTLPFSGTFRGGMFTLTYNAGTTGSYKEGLFAPFVGFTPMPVIIEHCMVDPMVVFQGIDNTATFVRAAPDVE